MVAAQRQLAQVNEAKAYHVGEFLILHIAGQKPNACHRVDLQQSWLDVEPPTFFATWFIDPRIRCTPDPQPYAYQESFQIGEVRGAVVLYHAGGQPMSVDVEDLTTQPEEADDVRGGMGVGILPVGYPPEGIEATGYSEQFDFKEAFQHAISQLPVSLIPDWLARYTVLEVGAEIGGLAGFNRMFVRVRGG